MALFDTYIRLFNGLNEFTAVKTKKSNQACPCIGQGYTPLGQLNATSKTAALKMAATQFDNGLLTPMVLSESKQTHKPLSRKDGKTKLAIFCDINGVLDDWNLWAEFNNNFGSTSSAMGTLRRIVSANKLMPLVKIALTHNAALIITSEWRKQGVTMWDLIRCVLLRDGDSEQKAFVEEHMEALFELTCDSTATKGFNSRNAEIIDHIETFGFTHCIVLEDDHQIESWLNPIRPSSTTGLEPHHFERIEQYITDFDLLPAKQNEVA
ncbi:hypothetical protein VCHA53O466_50225 [Vibrio chagasii]|nr:hypothetical protein VCHA53O466_50225 [Vibrio chagasii]